MINCWADLAKMRRDFPINSTIVIDEGVEETYWGEEVGGKMAKVTGYIIPDGMLEVVTETGKEIEIYPSDATLYIEPQMC